MKKINHVTKYTVIICIGLVIFNLIFGYVLTKEASKAMKTQINERMLDISNTAAAMINGDNLARITVNDLGSPEYQEVMDILKFFQDNTDLEYIYCIMQVGEKEFVYGVDPTIEDASEFGSPIEYTDALYDASKGKGGCDDIVYLPVGLSQLIYVGFHGRQQAFGPGVFHAAVREAVPVVLGFQPPLI